MFQRKEFTTSSPWMLWSQELQIAFSTWGV